MNLAEAFRVAWSALMINKLRALLTMLGIIIGVGTVVGMLAIGTGYSNFVESEFGKLGVGRLTVTPQIDPAASDEQLTPRLTAADADALMQPGAAPMVATVVKQFDGRGIVDAGKDRFDYQVVGATPNYFTVSTNLLGPGRYYTDAEERDGARVAVIGRTVAQDLFGGADGAPGRRITINGVNFEVVGVLFTKANQASQQNPAEQVYVPYSTARNRLFRNQLSAQVDVSQLTVQVRERDQADAALRQVTQVLRERHRLTYQSNDFSVESSEQLMTQFRSILAGFNAFLGVIGGISLLVGGIGIMNIMLVSVTQRTREIGLRKAVGARARDILLQFLIEAVVLCLIGGAIGIGFGFLLSGGGTFLLVSVLQMEGARAVVSLGSLVLATSVTLAVALCFGFFPALRAARLRPIVALRYE
ncbi:MAG TPA: ABC transporter permease [Kouleothrix sp.]|uniref:ABC transporter permease n=1 Tax=Kouleothrix sp. TaxID=2779161 RepID=UPI002BC79B2B|nr:ABC transporter permease [Kouleothrix sp.]HRC75351.1 ABC transporter permease [Kouleothrix sp.]